MISIILAVSENDVIGGNNKLLWYLPADLKHFKRITQKHTIIMGRKTYESIGRPLPSRTNIVITRKTNYSPEGVLVVNSIETAINKAEEQNGNEVFIIGGGEIYNQSIDIADKIYLTRVHQQFKGDVTFPNLDPSEWQIKSKEDHEADEKNKIPYSFLTYERIK